MSKPSRQINFLCYSDYMEAEILKKIGLSDSQANAYLILVDEGAKTPAELATKLGESRTNGYSIAERLIELGLARKLKLNKMTIEAENPTKIRTLLSNQQQQLENLNSELNKALPHILSKFRFTSDQPGVTNLRGKKALVFIYDEIIASGTDQILIFPAPNDHDDPEVSRIINQQIERQQQAGIKSLVLVQSQEYNRLKALEDNYLEVRKKPEELAFAAQIIIFKNIVVSSVFKEGDVFSTIITNPEMAQTLRSVFFLTWNQSS